MAQEELGSFSDDPPDIDEARAIAGNKHEQRERAAPTSNRDDSSQDAIELAVTQINYTIEGSDGTELPIINIFGRTSDGTVEHVRVHGFQPYFYTPRDSVSETTLSDLEGVIDWETSDPDGNPYESIRGERLLKIMTRTPRDVGQIRDQFEHYEADILFPNRFLIDKDITSGIRVPPRRTDTGTIDVSHTDVEAVDLTADLRICTMDIEVDDRQGFPEDGEEEIICLSSHDSFTDEYIAWLNAPEHVDNEGLSALDSYEFLSGDHAVTVRTFPSEDAMLNGFLEYVEQTDPDVLTGWNFSDFDAPYVLDRLERVNRQSTFDLDYNRLSRVDEVWRSDWQGPNIKGRIVFDLLYAYQRTQFTELDSYRLEAVAEQELGTGKERYTGNLGDLWETDPERLLEYNVRDVELCVQINEKQAIIPFWQEVASFVGCKLEDATTPGDAVDMYVLHKAHSQFVLPSKGQQDAEEFEGGAVFDPVTGVREMVTVLDLKSLYPMCMVTINASPETKVGDEFTGETYRAPNGQRFRKEPDGIIREMVEELLAERDDKKDRRDDHSPDTADYHRFDRQQAAVKVIMNSLYGVSGWERFRLYDKENAAAVTATGREVIRFTETAANELGYDVMYGDTDSVMLEFGGDLSKADAIDRSFEIAAHINERYDAFARETLSSDTHRFQIEFEKLYRRFFQASKKKRYAGHIIWKEGKDVDDIDITGFEYKRSDIAPITKEVQHNVLQKIVYGEQLADIESYVRDVVQDFRAGEFQYDTVGIPGGIGKRLDDYDTNTAHVRGANYANAVIGTNFQRGSKPKRLYLERVHPVFFDEIERTGPTVIDNAYYREFKRNSDVICFEYPDQLPTEGFEVDWEVMLEKTLQGPIARILEALEISWETVVNGEAQHGLDQFM